MKIITSSQIEAMSSDERSFTLSISRIEPKGFGCNGVNPEAKPKVRQNPSEPHFGKSPGIPCCCSFRKFGCTEKVPNDWLDEARARRLATEEVMILDTLPDTRCIVWVQKIWTLGKGIHKISPFWCFTVRKWVNPDDTVYSLLQPALFGFT